jgi:hypothetical protein
MYSSQSTCVEVDWSGIKLSFIPFHSNTCGLKWIHMHPNKARVILCYPKIVTSSWQDDSYRFAILLLTVYFYMPVSHRIPLDSAAEQGTGKWIW